MAERVKRQMASTTRNINPYRVREPTMAVTVMPDIEESPSILNIIDLTKYSTLIRVVRVTALLILFAKKWKTPEVYNDNILTTKEMLEARNLLLNK